MNKLLLVSAVLLSLFLQGCKKDDNNADMSCGERMQGGWRTYSFEQDGVQWLGYAGSGGLNYLEFEFTNYDVATNKGDLRISLQKYGEVPAPPINGVYSPNADCDRVETPDFLFGGTVPVRWDILKFDDNDIFMEANYSGIGFKIKMSRK